MPFADNDGTALYYETDGPDGGDRVGSDADGGRLPVVFVEGLGYGRWMWRWQRERLADDYPTVVWDNRGTGDSDAPDGPYSIAAMAADLEAVLADAGVERAHVVGASMGGMIAQQYALDHDRAETLSLLCTSHGGPDAVETPPETQTRMFDVPDEYDEREAIRYKMAPAMTDSFFEANDELISDIVDWRLAGDADADARSAQAAAVAAFDASDRLGDLDVPTLVLHGTADRVLPVENGESLAERLPDATLDLYDGGSHLFFVESADAVTDRIRRFLDGR